MRSLSIPERAWRASAVMLNSYYIDSSCVMLAGRSRRTNWTRARFELGRASILVLVVLVLLPLLPTSHVAACQPDFRLTVSPSSVTVKAGSSLKLYPPTNGLTVTSLCGLTGTINVGEKPPFVTNAPVVVPTRYDLPVSPTAPTSSTILTVSTNLNTPKGTYTLTIGGKDIQGGPAYGLSHSVTLTVTVT